MNYHNERRSNDENKNDKEVLSKIYEVNLNHISEVYENFYKDLEMKFEEILKNGYNLNLPRYIDSQQTEDLQDIGAHLLGGIPQTDIDALQNYWTVCPGLRNSLFTPNRPGYVNLTVAKSDIKTAIYGHAEFVAFTSHMTAVYDQWQQKSSKALKALRQGCHPKVVIKDLSEDLLNDSYVPSE